MRLMRILFQYKHPTSKARIPQNLKKIPFDPILPLKLRNRVSGKVDSQKQTVACLHEMSVLFAALKDQDFNEKGCFKEIETLRKAHMEALAKAREEKLKNAGVISTVGSQLNSKQLNKYLRKFPYE